MLQVTKKRTLVRQLRCTNKLHRPPSRDIYLVVTKAARPIKEQPLVAGCRLSRTCTKMSIGVSVINLLTSNNIPRRASIRTRIKHTAIERIRSGRCNPSLPRINRLNRKLEADLQHQTLLNKRSANSSISSKGRVVLSISKTIRGRKAAFMATNHSKINQFKELLKV